VVGVGKSRGPVEDLITVNSNKIAEVTGKSCTMYLSIEGVEYKLGVEIMLQVDVVYGTQSGPRKKVFLFVQK